MEVNPLKGSLSHGPQLLPKLGMEIETSWGLGPFQHQHSPYPQILSQSPCGAPEGNPDRKFHAAHPLPAGGELLTYAGHDRDRHGHVDLVLQRARSGYAYGKRPMEGGFPHLWLDAPCVWGRNHSLIASQAFLTPTRSRDR